MVNVGNKCYSVKSRIDFENDRQTLRLNIISVEEVSKNSPTSFSKLKTLYSSSFGSSFNSVRYKEIFSKITNVIAQKYKVSNIQYY